MRARLATIAQAVRASYWFLPTVMGILAIALSAFTTWLDAHAGEDGTLGLAWLSFNTAEGARALLSTIAGSMITVAGVTFSITIAAVAYASAQLGPRLLNNFMRDRGNQLTLGTFIATFVYCLLVLRTVHGGDAGEAGFVPHLSVLIALGLTIASIGVLIYFIHHIPKSIQVSEVVGDLGDELMLKVEELFPERVGEGKDERDAAADDAGALAGRDPALAVRAAQIGYVTHVDAARLFEVACAHGLVVELRCRPGSFVGTREEMVHVHGQVTEPDELRAAIRGAFAFGRDRTSEQDVLFIVQMLTEIAAQALSPGVNNPYTAISVLDWLGSALIELGGRSMPCGRRLDEDGRLRIVAPALAYGEVASAVFDDLRAYAANDRNVMLHMQHTIGRALRAIEHESYRRVLLQHAAACARAGEHGLGEPRDVEQVLAAYRALPGVA